MIGYGLMTKLNQTIPTPSASDSKKLILNASTMEIFMILPFGNMTVEVNKTLRVHSLMFISGNAFSKNIFKRITY